MNALLGVDQLGHLSCDGLNGHKSAQQVELARQGLLHHAMDINLNQLRDLGGRGSLRGGLDVLVTLQFDAHALRNLCLGLKAVVVSQDHQVVLDSAAVVLTKTADTGVVFLVARQGDQVVLGGSL